MRTFAFPVFVAAAVVIGASIPAVARWANPDTVGYCAAGTCNRLGGIRAANIKACKPEHCRDYVTNGVKDSAKNSLKTVAMTRPVVRKLACPAAPSYWPWSWVWPQRQCEAANEK